jgi:nitrogen fixation-related uncharacterized protein
MKDNQVLKVALGSIMALAIALGGFVWNVSAKNYKFEQACDKQIEFARIDTEHTATLALHNTAIAIIQKDISYIVDSIDELKRDRGLSVRRRATIDPNF